MAVSRPATIRATISVPPDKSISHRALIFNAIASGTAHIEGLLDSDDVRSTAACLRALGTVIDWPDGSTAAVVEGCGLYGLQEAGDVLNCGNSGTTMRLLAGLLAAQPGLSILTGDDSLRRRPMARIIEPLRLMGATVTGRREGTLPPVVIRGGSLKGIAFDSPVASAQVKTALLLAGLYATGRTIVQEPSVSRDHTERMLGAMGAALEVDGNRVTIIPVDRLRSLDIRVPGDISSAAPWLVLGACHPDAEITVRGVNTNPTRTGLLDIMTAMGADIELFEERLVGGEPVADIRVRSSRLRATEVAGGLVPRAIDELPLVAVLGLFAEGETVVRDAAELRGKESDRIEAVVNVLGSMGAHVIASPDGFRVSRAALAGAHVDGMGDHRIGMLAGIAGALAEGETSVRNDAVGVSYPNFWRDLAEAGAGLLGPSDKEPRPPTPTYKERRPPAVAKRQPDSPTPGKPVVLVLHGPAGAGKDAVINRLRERTGIRRATSATTRPARPGERDGVDYHFLSREEFQRGIDAGEFCEWAVVYDDFKGLQKSEIERAVRNGEDLIIRTDVQGARTWRKQLDGAVFVFILTDDPEMFDPDTLRKRLEERNTETEQTLETRLGELNEELADIPNNDYVVVNRDGHLEEAVDELQRILETERKNSQRAIPRLLS